MLNNFSESEIREAHEELKQEDAVGDIDHFEACEEIRPVSDPHTPSDGGEELLVFENSRIQSTEKVEREEFSEWQPKASVGRGRRKPAATESRSGMGMHRPR